MTIKVACVVPEPADALSFYRAAGPFIRMNRDYPGKYQFDFIEKTNWAMLGMYDILFMQRPWVPAHFECARIAKEEVGIPVIMDFDDYLMDLKEDNRSFEVYMEKPENVNSVKEMWKFADTIICVSEHLAKIYSTLGAKNVVVIPNAYDTDRFSYAIPPDGTAISRKKIVLWRGGSAHVHDIQTIQKGLEHAIRDNQDWSFVFINQRPWFLTEKFKNVHFEPGRALFKYFKLIHDMEPAIMYHPLSDCHFNRSKSACSWLEAGHASSAYLAPNFGEFQGKPGAHLYEAENPESFYDKLSSLMHSKDLMIQSIIETKKSVVHDYNLTKINKLRDDVFTRC